MTVDMRAESGTVLSVSGDALIIPVGEGGDGFPASGVAAEADAVLGGELRRLAEEARFSGKAGTTFLLPTLGRLPARRLVLAGTGPEERLDRGALRRAWGAAALAVREAGAADVVSCLPPAGGEVARGDALTAAAEGVLLALYRFGKYRAGNGGERGSREVASVRFVGDEIGGADVERSLRRAEVTAGAVGLARDLVNEPASVLTPAAMAAEAERVAAAAGLTVEVLGPSEMAVLGANAIAAVGRGSANEPRLIRLGYRPSDGQGGTGQRVVGLVGKCITFDTGGYSIKTYEGMLEMKGDMAGGAAVLGAMSALRDLRCPVAVEATICAAENMISGTAFRPGDILTAMNGVTIEILSTDAEGRLVLADGLVDTARRGATELIDLATLTGAAVVALGDGTTALFASDDGMAERVLGAAAAAGERSWRLPLIEELNEKIKGDVGDVKNSGGRAGGGRSRPPCSCSGFGRACRGSTSTSRARRGGRRPGRWGRRGRPGVGVLTLLAYLSEVGATTEA
jgi:leucyl aminopeptidase